MSVPLPWPIRRAATTRKRTIPRTVAIVLAISLASFVFGGATRVALALFTDSEASASTFTTAASFGTSWWNASYGYRKQITVTAGSAVAAGYSVKLTLDHAALVGAGKSQADGDDVRIVYWNSGTSSWVELNRVLEVASAWNSTTTALWFPLQAAIAGSGTDTNYYVHYGNPAAVAPPASPASIFSFWDDFDDGTLGASWTILRPPAAGWSESMGSLNIFMDPSEDFWGATNTATLFHVAPPAGDFEVQVIQYGNPSASGHSGGLMIYQDDSNYLANFHRRPSFSAQEAFLKETPCCTSTTSTSLTANPVYIRLRKIGTSYTAWYSTNGGSSFSQLGGAQTVTLSGIRTGVTAFSTTTNVNDYSFDDFRVRALVSAEPALTLGAEELAP